MWHRPVNLTVKDDVPTAVNDTAASVAEDAAAIGGNVLTNDTQGADGAAADACATAGGSLVVISSGTEGPTGVFSFTVNGIGVYTFQANGAWTFDPVLNQNQNPSDVVANVWLPDHGRRRRLLECDAADHCDGRDGGFECGCDHA
jgi:hypothetical protein